MIKHINLLLIFAIDFLAGQAKSLDEVHYPFNHNKTHNEVSNCRSYAMAVALPGSYCPPGKVGDIDAVSSALFEPKPWDISKIEVRNLVIWGDGNPNLMGSDHVAVITEILGESTDEIFVTHKISASEGIVNRQRLSEVRGYDPTHYAIPIPNVKLKVENRYSDDIAGGKIGIQHGWNSMVEENSVYTGSFEWGSRHSLTAIMNDRKYNGSRWKFIGWTDASDIYNIQQVSSNKVYQLKLIYNSTNHYIADYKEKFEVTIKNDFKGVGNIGNLVINDTNRAMPFTLYVPENESITVSAPLNSVTHNHIDYDFTHWSTGSEFHTITITPTSDTTITAHYKGYPRSMAHYGLTSGTVIGDNIKLTWNVHPNQNVSRYDIYRKIKPKLGPWGSRIKITSVNRNATSWIDPQYILTNGYSNDLLLYDVSPFYATESTNAKIDWTVSFGEDFDSDDFFKKRENEQYSIPNEFNLGQNYPNPFNPTTTIKYELPEASSVSISIYDIRGNEIKTWENVNEQPGFKQKTWQAIDNHGNKVPAGIYIYKLTATSHETDEVFSKSMKMVMLK